jgi:hypothetical protein
MNRPSRVPVLLAAVAALALAAPPAAADARPAHQGATGAVDGSGVLQHRPPGADGRILIPPVLDPFCGTCV